MAKFVPSLDEEDNEKQYGVNQKNSQEFENLMENSKKKYDQYWDIHNPVIRIILFILFVIIVIGSSYYFILWFTR